MVPDGDVLVVGEEGLVGAEHGADEGGVVDGGVEVGVVGDIDGFEKDEIACGQFFRVEQIADDQAAAIAKLRGSSADETKRWIAFL